MYSQEWYNELLWKITPEWRKEQLLEEKREWQLIKEERVKDELNKEKEKRNEIHRKPV